MKDTRSELMRKILLTLDHNPSSIYDLQYSIENFSDPKRTRLPKLLKAMERENLVVSALQPGPLGPYRRIYQLGPEAKNYLTETLRDGLETLLHFYREYRRSNPEKIYNLGKNPNFSTASGNFLYLAYPTVNVDDVNEIRELAAMREINLFISGTDSLLAKTGIRYSVIVQENLNFQLASETISEIRMRGVPPRSEISKVIAECKRILERDGKLIIKTPYVFFDESKKSSLMEFIRITAEASFPDLGMVEGLELTQVIESNFTKSGSYETSLGEVVFWATK